jgi:hypothetical protein
MNSAILEIEPKPKTKQTKPSRIKWIDSISLNPDTVLKTTAAILQEERAHA